MTCMISAKLHPLVGTALERWGATPTIRVWVLPFVEITPEHPVYGYWEFRIG